MNSDLILKVLSNSKDDAKSMREIAQAMGLDISSHASWVRTQNTLSRVLRVLCKWGWVTHDYRPSDDGKNFWHNAYWKTEIAISAQGRKF